MKTPILVGLAAVVVFLAGWLTFATASQVGKRAPRTNAVFSANPHQPLLPPSKAPTGTTSGTATVNTQVRINEDNVNVGVRVPPKSR